VVAEEQAKSPVAGDEPLPSGPQSERGRRILVVDDNQDSAATLGHLLRLLGHEVRVLHDGAETLTVSETFRPEMILLDIGLPGLDGLEVARRLRADARFDSVVVAALTGYGSPEDRQQSHDVGFNAHFVKPVDLETLKRMLVSPDALLPEPPSAPPSPAEK
jgi:CheY-like chemotaxis protein